jgi:hypothetical protein
MNRLDVFRVIVSPCPSHSARTDVVGDDVAVVGERFLAEGAYAILGDDLPVEEFLTLPPQNVSLSKLFQCERVAKMTKATRGRYTLEFKQEAV